MGVTVYSIVISILFFNLALLAAFLMRRSSVLLARRSVSFLLLMVLLGIVRLLTPIDFDMAYVVRSYQLIPRIEAFLKRPVIGTISLGSLLLAIWLGGTVSILIADGIRQLRFVRQSRNFPPSDRRDLLELAAEYGSNFGVLVSSAISRPYVAGLFQPVIYLPDIELPEEQWRIILRHEVQHIRALDEWKKLFFAVVQALFWWNPLAHISRREIDTMIELQCDARVTAGMSDEEVDTYLETLLALLKFARDRRLPATAATLVWNDAQMEVRFKALDRAGANEKKCAHTAMVLLLASLFLLSYLVIIQPAYYYPEEEILTSPNGNLAHDTTPKFDNASSMLIVNADGSYQFFVDGEYVGVLDEAALSDPRLDSLPLFDVPIIDEYSDEGVHNEKTD